MQKNRFRSASLALAGILIAIGGCAESPAAPAAPKFLERGPAPSFDIGGTAAVVIDSRGGTVQSLSGDRIVFPAGAVSSPVLVTLTSDRKYVGVELQPHGTTFAEGHEPTLILNGGSASRANIVYTNDAGAVVEVLDTDVENGQIRASLHHFSKYYAVGG
jgi:hypothetical protein